MYHLRLNKNPAPRLHYCFLATPPWTLYPSSLPGLATVQICALKLREGHGGWSLFPIRNWGMHNSFYTQEPHRVLVSFKAKHWLHLSPSGSCSAHLLRCVWISPLSCVPSWSHVLASLLPYCLYLYDPSFLPTLEYANSALSLPLLSFYTFSLWVYLLHQLSYSYRRKTSRSWPQAELSLGPWYLPGACWSASKTEVSLLLS